MNDCCSSKKTAPHLVIIGGGSAAFSAALGGTALGARVTMINDGLPIGGTCVNVGCVPSKALLRAAESHHRANHNCFAGLESSSRVADFGALMRQKAALVEELRQAKYLDVVADLPEFERIEGRARLVGPRTVAVGQRRLEADRILIATGATTAEPDIEGLGEVGYLTNESLFELETLPRSLLVVGGGYIGLECAQMFARLGSEVTVVQRSGRVLGDQMPDLTEGLSAYLREEGIKILIDTQIQRVERRGEHIVAQAAGPGGSHTLRATHMLVAPGRRANTWDLGVEAAGVTLDARGFVAVSDTLQTSAPGIYAAGDVIGEPLFVYTAAYEGALAAENALTDAEKPRDYSALPWVVFTDPQVAGVGLDEHQAAEAGIEAEAATLPLSHVPRAIAARDTRGFIKLIREVDTHRLLGARMLAPEGGELVTAVATAVRAGMTSDDMAAAFHPYLTLSEGLKLAAITFGKDVATLSCCAA